jgi:hypothetical protein
MTDVRDYSFILLSLVSIIQFFPLLHHQQQHPRAKPKRLLDYDNDNDDGMPPESKRYRHHYPTPEGDSQEEEEQEQTRQRENS